jgi:alanyl-tRNA synthetase
LKMLAAKICSRPGVVVLLADHSDQLRVVFARSADSTVDVAALLKRTIEQFGGRGGGRRIRSGRRTPGRKSDQVLQFAKEHLLHKRLISRLGACNESGNLPTEHS